MVQEEQVKAWFFREIFPLEAALTRFLQRNWRNPDDISDFRQEIYARIYESARERLPLQPKPFLFTVARNHLINCAKRQRVVVIDLVPDLEALDIAVDSLTPERHLSARDELRRVRDGLENLPQRCREVVVLRKIDGLSQREVAQKLHISEGTVERQMVFGMRALVDYMLGGSGKIQRGPNFGRKERSAS